MSDEKKDQKTNDQPEVDKKEDSEKEKSEQENKMREIILLTDGNNVRIVKNETAGKIELIGILQTLTQFLMNNK